ncbi:hypothetical protein F6U93_08360 [Tamlana haliotis]|uniref:Uncharacterized protein n=1 Tax=Pseudotamlana haliotis TaxID=2614804 RepID=A0A6N6MF28_9FLAO|nr:hypothetical protein [Tamlana haliotis]KAB1067944.1 hypothetical protein F6U93_08360 [Tamlana haliotis]
MIKKTINPFSAKVTIGLVQGYSKTLNSKASIIKHIQKLQDELIQSKKIFLTAAVSETIIVMSRQKEPHLTLNFINYPKFPLPETVLKEEIERLTKKLMIKFKQNRVVIEYLDETIMFEQSEGIDPNIRVK